MMLIGFWASPSDSGKNNWCQGPMLYVQHTFYVISFLDVFVVYVCLVFHQLFHEILGKSDLDLLFHFQELHSNWYY